jgi:hypothetical protein
VHLNGRVYDPYVGRMLSADPVVGDPLNGQTWNRYSYVYNNPLAYTDPTGYCPVCIQTANLSQPRPSTTLQLIGAIFRIAAVAICSFSPGCQVFMPLVVVATSSYFAGVTSGSLTVALQAGVIAVGTEYAFDAVGTLTLGPMHAAAEFGSAAYFANVAGHALVGCGAAVASGGKCGPGALSAVVPAAAGPFLSGLNWTGRLVASTTLGGLASVAGGGKFANGAVTGAFGYLFNDLGGSATSANGATGGDSVYVPPAGVQVACPWCLVIAADAALLATGAGIEIYDGLNQPARFLEDLANAIHGALDPVGQGMRTTAVLSTAEGTTLVGGGQRDLDPEQRFIARSLGLVDVRLSGQHAEITVLQAAKSMGVTPMDLAVTRPICDACADYIRSTGGRLTSHTMATWR